MVTMTLVVEVDIDKPFVETVLRKAKSYSGDGSGWLAEEPELIGEIVQLECDTDYETYADENEDDDSVYIDDEYRFSMSRIELALGQLITGQREAHSEARSVRENCRRAVLLNDADAMDGQDCSYVLRLAALGHTKVWY